MTALVLVFGLVWGSFLLVIADRINDIGSVFNSRSHCPKCKKKLGPVDLIPLVSFVILRGKCRNCRDKIGLIYPAIELLTALILFLIYFKFSINLLSVVLSLSVSVLLVASIVDAKAMEVDLWLFIAGILLALIWFFGNTGLNFQTLISLAWGILVAIILPLVFYLISRESWMGLGDVLFALWAACLLGFPQALGAIFIAFLSGAVFGIILLIVKGKKVRSMKVSFGPFIALGAFIMLIFGQQITSSYLKLIGF